VQAMSEILQIQNVTRQFGGLTAVNRVNLTLQSGEIRALIGPNGAGKTSLFNLITGVLKCTAGRIQFKGEEIAHLPSYQRFKLGIGRSFQLVNLFTNLTVEQNVQIAVQGALKRKTHPLERIDRKNIEQKTDETLTRFQWFKDRAATAGSLIYAEQKKLETLMALTSEPDLLLLDEPTAGIDEDDINLMVDMIRLSSESRTVLLTDHDVRFVMKIADTITVLDQGAIIAEGTPDEIAANSKVDEVYIGGSC
jgi:branched-chain amino acid transport system ATP-binding protein